MAQRSPARWQVALGLLVGGSVGVLLPLGASQEQEPAFTSDVLASPDPAPAAPVPPALPPVPRGALQADAAVHEAYRAQRTRVLTRWGWPPEPPPGHAGADADQVRAVIASLTDLHILDVDCAMYPCVAALFGFEEDPELREEVAARWPHAVIRTGTAGSRSGQAEAHAVTVSLALLEQPLEPGSPQRLFTNRLAMAIEHRTAQDRVERMRGELAPSGSDGSGEAEE